MSSGNGACASSGLPVTGCCQLQPRCVQCLAREFTQRGAQLLGRAFRQREPAAVNAVTDDRVIDVREVHADLVSAPGFELHADVRVRTETPDHAVMRDGIATAVADRHAHAVRRVPVDRRVDRAARRHHAPADGFVFAMNLARLEHPHQRGVRLERAGHDQQSARVLVEPVHDAGARQPAEFGVARQQRVLQRLVGVAGAGMHDQPGGFVDDEDVLVLVRHHERNGLGFRCRFLGHGAGNGDHFTAVDLVPGAANGPVDQHFTGLDPRLEAAAGVVGQQASKRLVETLARFGVGNLQAELNG